MFCPAEFGVLIGSGFSGWQKMAFKIKLSRRTLPSRENINETQSHRGHRVTEDTDARTPKQETWITTARQKGSESRRSQAELVRSPRSEIYGSLRRLLLPTRFRQPSGACPVPHNTAPVAWSVRGRPASVHGSSNRCRRPCRRSSLA